MRSCLRILVACAVALAAASACNFNTADIEQSWRAPSARPGQIHNVIVLAPAENETIRRSAELKLASRLRGQGVNAVPGYALLTSADLRDRQRIAHVARAGGYDSLIVMRFVGREERLDWVPMYGAYWGDAWGTVIPETIIRIEITAYSVDDNRMLWTALSRSVDPEDIGEVIDDVTAVAATELVNERLVSRSATARL